MINWDTGFKRIAAATSGLLGIAGVFIMAVSSGDRSLLFFMTLAAVAAPWALYWAIRWIALGFVHGEERRKSEKAAFAMPALMSIATAAAYFNVAIVGLMVVVFFSAGESTRAINSFMADGITLLGLIQALKRRMLWPAVTLTVYGVGMLGIKFSQVGISWSLLGSLVIAGAYIGGLVELVKSHDYSSPTLKDMPWKRIGIFSVLSLIGGFSVGFMFALLGLTQAGVTAGIGVTIAYMALGAITQIGIFIGLTRKIAYPLEAILCIALIISVSTLTMVSKYPGGWAQWSAEVLISVSYGMLAWAWNLYTPTPVSFEPKSA